MKRFLQHILWGFINLVIPPQGAELCSVSEFSKEAVRSVDTLPNNAVAVFEYRQPIVRGMIWEWKFRGNHHAIDVLAQTGYEVLIETLSEEGIFSGSSLPILLPIPSSKTSLAERGFWHVDLMGKKFAEIDGGNNFIHKNNILVRATDGVRQTRAKNKSERLKNLRDAYKIEHPEIIRDQLIILLDDITTTGATFSEAKRACLAAGARKVICFALAH